MPGKLNPYALIAVILTFPGQMLFAQERDKIRADWYGYIGGDFRYFHDQAIYDGQEETYFSSVFKPQLFLETASGKNQLYFIGFLRLDQYDDKRTHADIRDLYWRYSRRSWELNAGVKTVTWGKTESNHLVDIINQYDLVEGRNLEHKLGQPLIQFIYAPSWISIEFYVMTLARKLQFPGYRGRLRPGFAIDYQNPEYEKKNGQYLPDYAVRLSNSLGNLDLGISHFYGTNRLPQFKPGDQEKLVPFYDEIYQAGLEAQWLTGSFAWKLEAIHQMNERQEIWAYTIGGEYNMFFRAGPEIKLMVEYTYDERGDEQISGINNDLFAGANLNFNDRQSTNFLLAAIYDVEYQTTIVRSQLERRIGDSWKVSMMYSGIINSDPEGFYHLIRNDSFLEIGLLHYFQN